MALIVILVLRSFRGPGRTAISVDREGRQPYSDISFLRCLPAVRRIQFSIFQPPGAARGCGRGDLYRRAREWVPARPSPGDPSADGARLDADDVGGLIRADPGPVNATASRADCQLSCRVRDIVDRIGVCAGQRQRVCSAAPVVQERAPGRWWQHGRGVPRLGCAVIKAPMHPGTQAQSDQFIGIGSSAESSSGWAPTLRTGRRAERRSLQRDGPTSRPRRGRSVRTPHTDRREPRSGVGEGLPPQVRH